MKKTLVTLIIAGALLTPAMTSFAQGTEDAPVLISAEETTQEFETATIEKATASDIEKYINDDTVIIGKDGKAVEAVNEGDKFIVDTYTNIAVILESDYNGSVDISMYSANGGDETATSFINSSKTLVLNVSDETAITDTEGNKLAKEDIEGKTLVVYYSATTRSLPPQTSPEKIVVVNDNNEASGTAEAATVFNGTVESFENGVLKTADNSYTVNKNTVIIGKDGKKTETVAKGDKVAVDTKNNVVAVLDAEYAGTIKVDVYSKSGEEDFGEFISSDKNLALNIGDETVITDLSGKTLSKNDIDGRKAVVYYSIATMSIPPQTNPEKIVVLDETAEAPVTENKSFTGIVESYENGVLKTADNSYTMYKNTVILNDKETIEKGDRVFVNAEKQVVAVTDADYAGNVFVGNFKKSDTFGMYVDANGELALNIGDETKITDLRGNDVSKDNLDNTLLAVYYTTATMSIPAQTNPEKIVVIDADQQPAAECSFTYGDKTYTVALTDNNGSSYVPVRAVAENLGFVVGWDGENVTVSVSEDEKVVAFKVQETALNDKGDVAYISSEDLTYVPVEFFSHMIPNTFDVELNVSFN